MGGKMLKSWDEFKEIVDGYTQAVEAFDFEHPLLSHLKGNIELSDKVHKALLEECRFLILFLPFEWREQVYADELVDMQTHTRIKINSVDGYWAGHGFAFRDIPYALITTKNTKTGFCYIVGSLYYQYANFRVEGVKSSVEDI